MSIWHSLILLSYFDSTIALLIFLFSSWIATFPWLQSCIMPKRKKQYITEINPISTATLFFGGYWFSRLPNGSQIFANESLVCIVYFEKPNFSGDLFSKLFLATIVKVNAFTVLYMLSYALADLLCRQCCIRYTRNVLIKNYRINAYIKASIYCF